MTMTTKRAKYHDKDGKHAKSTSMPGRSPLSHFFERVDDIDSLSADDFLERFERFGFLWFKGSGSNSSPKIPTENEILDFVKKYSFFCEKSWTIENYSKDIIRNTAASSPQIAPQKLHDCTGTNKSFYVSTIIHRKSLEERPQQDASNCDTDHEQLSEKQTASNQSSAYLSLMKMLPKFDNVFEDIYENWNPSGIWLFLGHHGVSEASANSSGSGKKKRKKRTGQHGKIHNGATTTILSGRAEHVDEVTHSGTYHIQIAGTKTWKIRPHPDSFLGEEFKLDSEDGGLLRDLPGSEQGESGGKNDKRWRIKITVEEGDVFVLNTKVWYHCTELNYDPHSLSFSSSEWSISAAQDFYLPVPCPRNVEKGGVVYGYDAEIDEEKASDEYMIDQEIPDELPRSDDPNCALVEIGVNDGDDHSANNDNDVEDDELSTRAKIALVALRDIVEGESLTIAFDSEEDQLGNGNEQIDPRVISRQYWNKNEIVLRGEDRMPQDIPRSYEPNCEFIEIDEGKADTCLALRALVDIPEGGVFCILPDEDEEYDEVEVELGTGELMQ